MDDRTLAEKIYGGSPAANARLDNPKPTRGASLASRIFRGPAKQKNVFVKKNGQ